MLLNVAKLAVVGLVHRLDDGGCSLSLTFSLVTHGHVQNFHIETPLF